MNLTDRFELVALLARRQAMPVGSSILMLLWMPKPQRASHLRFIEKRSEE